MSSGKILERDHGLDPGGFQKRWPFSIDIALQHVHGRFIDGKPVSHILAQLFGDEPGVTSKYTRAVLPQPSAGAREPGRISEMVQGYDRLQIPL